MARLRTTSALLLLALSRVSAQSYQLIQEYNASNIFEEFNFFNGSDPTGGFVQYVPFEVAANTPLIGNSSDLVYIGVDDSNVYAPGGLGRPSVRLESKLTFTEGLFVFDLTHIPVGCGTWPALWTTGLSDWPLDGEIDIIENVNDARSNNAAIHATGNCTVNATTAQTGIWKSTDCDTGHDENQGCGTVFTEPFNYGSEFNANGGGVYAMEWTSDTIQIWFFPPTNVPESLSNGDIPDSSTFGIPSASFSGPCSDSFSEKLFNHSIVIDTTFCGGWAGDTFGSGSSSCPLKQGLSPRESCVEYVASNPGAFKDAFWGFRSIKVWEKVTGFTVPGLAAPGITLPTPVATIEPVDVLIKGPSLHNASKLATMPTPFNVSPLTGGVIEISDAGADFDADDDDSSSDDLEDIIDAPDLPTGSDSLSDILDTQEPSGIIIDVDVDPITSDISDFVDEDDDLAPVSSIGRPPYGFGNTESPKDILAPKLSPPLPTKGRHSFNSKAAADVEAPYAPSIRQQIPSSSDVPGAQTPNTPPLVFPVPLNVSKPSSDNFNANISDITPSELPLPEPILPVEDPQLDAPDFTPPKHSNPLIPAANGNTGIVPPHLRDNPLVSLWNSFTPELKSKLIAAATALPTPSPWSSPLNDLWASLSPDLKKEVLDAANNLPDTSLENSVPTISDLINAASSGRIPNVSDLQGHLPLASPPVVKPGGGLLAFLDEKTKNKLKALLGQTSVGTTDGNELRRQIPVETSDPSSVAASLEPAPFLNASTLPVELSESGPKLNLTPAVPVTALSSADTAQAMSSLFGLFDEGTKQQIANMLLGDGLSNADDSEGVPAGNIRTENNPLRSRQAPTNWTTADKLALAQNIYTLCPAPFLIGIPFPSPNELAADLLDPKKTLEDATAAFQRKLQSYFNVTVQGCWSKINQWLAWRHLLRNPTAAKSLPPSSLQLPITRIQKRQDESQNLRDSDSQGLLEQQIYTICPKPETFTTDQLIADLEDPTTSIQDAIDRFQNKLWAYMAKLQACSDQIRSYGPKLKALSTNNSTQPIFHTTNDGTVKHLAERQSYPSLAGLSPTSILLLLSALPSIGQSYDTLPGREQKKIFYDLLAGVRHGWPGNPRTEEQLKDLVLQLTKATLPVQKQKLKRRGDNIDYPSLAGLSPTSILLLLSQLPSIGQSYNTLPGREQKKIFYDLLAGVRHGWPGNPRTEEQLKDLVLQLTKATVPVPVQKQKLKRRGDNSEYPSLAGLPPTSILLLLSQLPLIGQSYNTLPGDEQKRIFYNLLAGVRKGWPGNPRTLDQLEDLVLQLTKATLPVKRLKKRGDYSDYPSLAGLPPTSILLLLSKLPLIGQSYNTLPGDEQKRIFYNLLAGVRKGWPGNPRTIDQLEDLVLQLTKATVPVKRVKRGEDYSDYPRHGYSDYLIDGYSDYPSLAGLPPTSILLLLSQLPLIGQSYNTLPGDEQKRIFYNLLAGIRKGWPGNPRTLDQLEDLALQLLQATVPVSAKGRKKRQSYPSLAGLPPTAILTLLSTLPQIGQSYNTLPGKEQKKIYDNLLAGVRAGWPGNPRTPEQFQNLVLQLTQATVPPALKVAPQNLTNTQPPPSDYPGDANVVDTMPVDPSGPHGAPGDGVITEPVPVVANADDNVSTFKTSQAGTGGSLVSLAPGGALIHFGSSGTLLDLGDGLNGLLTGNLINNNVGSSGDINPNINLPIPIERRAPPSRITRGMTKRQEDQNGVIPDADAPADLDQILGPHGTLDPFGFLGPEMPNPSQSASPDSQDQPNVADDEQFHLPDTAVDEASADVDQVLAAGPLDPFGQLKYSKDVADVDLRDELASKQFLGKLRSHEQSQQSVKYLGDPKDVDDFVNKYFNGSVSGTAQVGKIDRKESE